MMPLIFIKGLPINFQNPALVSKLEVSEHSYVPCLCDDLLLDYINCDKWILTLLRKSASFCSNSLTVMSILITISVRSAGKLSILTVTVELLPGIPLSVERTLNV